MTASPAETMPDPRRTYLACLIVTLLAALLVLMVGSGRDEQLPMDPGTPPEVKLIGTRP